jgi:acetyl-CoA carboxylase biotin carboxyl carrier protein
VRFIKRFKMIYQELVDLVGEEDVGEVEVERRILGWRIRVARRASAVQAPIAAAAVPAAQGEPEAQEEAVPEELAGLHQIVSPMVGMFYRAPGPDVPSCVEEGDIVSPGQTLGIIEAMKIMNEIEADLGGKIVRILVENGSPVEYNTPLFLLEPL